MDGYLVVDKPAGPSSHSTVQAVRRALGIGGRRGTKAGHAGTLDPFATGLMLVLVGNSTRLMQYVVGHDKRYLVSVQLGVASTTDDVTGELVRVGGTMPTRAAVDAALATLATSSAQVPPQVSALHVDGERAWRRVLRGEQLDLPTRPVHFDALDLLTYDQASGQLELDVRCSTGTYMRALARDLGLLLDSAGHVSQLRRLEVGPWSLDGAIAPDDASASDLRPPVDLLAGMPQVDVDAAQLQAFIRGQRTTPTGLDTLIGSHTVAVNAPDGSLAGIGRIVADDATASLQPTSVFAQLPAAPCDATQLEESHQ